MSGSPARVDPVDDLAVVNPAKSAEIFGSLPVLRRQNNRSAAIEALLVNLRLHGPDLRVDVVQRPSEQRTRRAVWVVPTGEPVGDRKLLRRGDGLEVHPENRWGADVFGA